MSGHPVRIEDRERVRCRGNPTDPCGARATWCEYSRFALSTKGGGGGISFWYYCDAHGPHTRVLDAKCRKREGLPDPDGPLARWRSVYAGHCTHTRRHISKLIRLAAAIEGLPRQAASDAADALWRHIRGRDGGRDPVGWAQRIFRDAYIPGDHRPPDVRVALPSWLRPPSDEQAPDPRPGRYYVTAIPDGAEEGTAHFVAGPYETHAEALSLVEEAKDHVGGRDMRATWMSWGTARTEPDAPTIPTILGVWRSIPPPSSPTSASATPAPTARPEGGRRKASSRRASRANTPTDKSTAALVAQIRASIAARRAAGKK